MARDRCCGSRFGSKFSSPETSDISVNSTVAARSHTPSLTLVSRPLLSLVTPCPCFGLSRSFSSQSRCLSVPEPRWLKASESRYFTALSRDVSQPLSHDVSRSLSHRVSQFPDHDVPQFSGHAISNSPRATMPRGVPITIPSHDVPRCAGHGCLTEHDRRAVSPCRPGPAPSVEHPEPAALTRL